MNQPLKLSQVSHELKTYLTKAYKQADERIAYYKGNLEKLLRFAVEKSVPLDMDKYTEYEAHVNDKCENLELEKHHIAELCTCLSRIEQYINEGKLDNPVLYKPYENDVLLNDGYASELIDIDIAKSTLVCAKRKDNGEWVKGYYFCLHHNDERTHIHHFVIPYDTPIPKDKPIGEIQVEIDPYSIRENKMAVVATRHFDFNVRIMGKDQCLEIAKIAVLDDPKAESDDLLRYLPDHVFGNTFEALAVNDGCVIVKDKKNNEWSVPFYFIESSMNR
jgi:hypothetical protein